MKSTNTYAVVGFLFLTTLTPQTLAAYQDPQKFLAEYKEASAHLQKTYEQIVATGQITETKAKVMVSSYSIMFNSYRNAKKIQLLPAGPPTKNSASQLFCLSGASGFGLARTGGSPTYDVNWLEPNDRIRRKFASDGGMFLEMPFAISQTPIYEWLVNPTVRNMTVERYEQDNHHLVKVKFENGKPDKPNMVNIIFDSDLGFAMRFFDFVPITSVPDMRHTKYEVNYEQTPVSIPRIKDCKHTDTNDTIRKCVFDTFSFAPTHEQEFKLDNYINFDNNRQPDVRWSFSLWLTISASVVLLLGIIIRRQLRHSNKRRQK